MERPNRGYFKGSNAMAFDPNLSDGGYRLYGALKAIAMNALKIDWLKEMELASMLGLNVKTVQRRLKELHDLGYIVQPNRGSPRFVIEIKPDSFGLEGDKNVALKKPKGDRKVAQRATDLSSKGDKSVQKGDKNVALPIDEARAEFKDKKDKKEEIQEQPSAVAGADRAEEAPTSGEGSQENGHPGIPTTLRELAAGMDAFTDDPKQLERLRKKALVWFQRLTACKKLKGLADDDLIDWIHEALSESMDAKDIVKYASAVLKSWMQAGDRPRKVQPAANGVVETPKETLALFSQMAKPNGKHST